MAIGKANKVWLVQRITAVLLIPLFIWFLFSLFQVMPMDYATAKAWVASPLNTILLGAFVIILYHHAWMGLHEVIEDYVHAPGLKRLTLLGILAIIALLTLFSLHSLFTIHS
jgi:succinate dehydrogenase / fumarate reductase membrane anchor subunit